MIRRLEAGESASAVLGASYEHLLRPGGMSADPNVSRAAALETATISDALDRLGIVGQCRGIQGRDPDFRMAGRAFTMRCGPASTPPGTVGDYIDDVPAGAIVVIDNGGRTEATIWGDILTEIAHRRGLGGTLIDGISRDVHLCRALGYPVFGRGHWMRTGKDRVQVEELGCAVDIGGARVAPGDNRARRSRRRGGHPRRARGGRARRGRGDPCRGAGDPRRCAIGHAPGGGAPPPRLPRLADTERRMIIDCHGHISAPVELWAYKAGLLSHRGAHGRGGVHVSDGELIAAAHKKEVWPDGHIELLHSHGTDMQLISPRPYQMMSSARPRKVVHWFCEEVNTLIHRPVPAHPRRVHSVAGLPQAAGEPIEAVFAEIDRCVSLGFKGFLLNPDPFENGTEEAPGLGDRYWYPLYEKLCALDMRRTSTPPDRNRSARPTRCTSSTRNRSRSTRSPIPRCSTISPASRSSSATAAGRCPISSAASNRARCARRPASRSGCASSTSIPCSTPKARCGC